MNTSELGKRAYTIDEVKAMYSLGRNSIYRLINEGQLKHVKVGRRTLILAADLAEFEATLTAENNGETHE